jgi:hypothetical protein
MPFWVKLLIRTALSLVLAALMSRFFFRGNFAFGLVVLTLFFLGMGYLSEYVRRRG